MEKINLKSKLRSFTDHWVPKIVGELNGQYVKVVKFEGEYVWHHHEHEDELFLVIEGHIDIHFRRRGEESVVGSVVGLDEGEFCIVPRGVEHKPAAARPASVLLFEPATTRNTGNVTEARTIEAGDLPRI